MTVSSWILTTGWTEYPFIKVCVVILIWRLIWFKIIKISIVAIKKILIESKMKETCCVVRNGKMWLEFHLKQEILLQEERHEIRMTKNIQCRVIKFVLLEIVGVNLLIKTNAIDFVTWKDFWGVSYFWGGNHIHLIIDFTLV